MKEGDRTIETVMEYTDAHGRGEYVVIGKQGQMDGNNFKSQMPGFASLCWPERFTSQWRYFFADIIRFLTDNGTS